jgi:hypothetical protein
MATDLNFDPATHTYTVGGVVVPSVTRILRPLTDFSHVPPDVLARAAAFGTAVHRMIYLEEGGDLDEEALDPILRPWLNAWRKWRTETKLRVLERERPVYKPLMQYAGTMDMLGELGRHKVVLDLKTGGTSPAAGPQTWAYRQAWATENGVVPETIKRAVLRIPMQPGTQLPAPPTLEWQTNDSLDGNLFRSCYQIYLYLNPNGERNHVD